MAVGMVLFWALVIGGIVMLIRLATGNHAAGGATPPDTDARQLLALRFARGEIDEAEFRGKLAVLRDHVHL
ncbi:SHOCT domain-containing protein [Mycobacterium sp. PSTR-4-N]|nr:SHOCT domain-containing protein [Mycobacterium sp. PSTR-4-N]MCG7593033.1 SHOCT domain-containing protein [Mycobacterium sp. PSTR-4-N]